MLKKRNFNPRRMFYKAAITLSLFGNAVMHQSCDKEDDVINYRDTEYVFGRANYTNIHPAEAVANITKDGKDKTVKNVIIRVDPKAAKEGYEDCQFEDAVLKNIIDSAIKPAEEAANGKLVGRGTFERVTNMTPADSTYLVGLGFGVSRLYKDGKPVIR